MRRFILAFLAVIQLEGAGCATAGRAGSGSLEQAQVSENQPFDQPPRLIHPTRPKYPQDAFVRRVQGTVELEILIDKTGRVIGTRVLKSIPALDAAAIACVREWRFRPARHAGEPVATRALAPVTFRIFRDK